MIITKPKNTLSPEEVMASFASEESSKSKIASDSVSYSVLANMAKELEEIMSTSPQSIAQAEEEEDPSLYTDLRASLLKMVAFLEKNKIDVTNFHASKSELSMKLDKATLEELKRNNDELMEEIAKQEAEQAKQQRKSLIAKIFITIAVTIAVAVLSVLTAGAVAAGAAAIGGAAAGASAATAATAATATAVAAGTATATAATATAATTAVAAGVAAATSTSAMVGAGVAAATTLVTMMPVTSDGQSALTLATTELAEAMSASGIITEEEAQLIANIMATIVITALSFGAAYLAAPVATVTATTSTAAGAARVSTTTASQLGRDALNVAGVRSTAVNVVADTAEEAIEQAIRVTSNDLRSDYIKYITRTAFVNGASSTGLLSSSIEAMPDDWFKDKEQKEKAVMSVGIIEMALAGIYSGFSTYSMTKSLSGNSLTMNRLAASDRAGGWISPARKVFISNLNTGALIFNNISNLLIGTMLAITSFNMANQAQAIRELEAKTMLLNNALNSNTRTGRDDLNTQRSILDSQAAMTNAYADLAASGKELAEALKA